MSPQAGEVITWDLPDQGFLGGGWVDLWVRLPAAEVGMSYPVTLTVSSGEPDANPSDNAVVVQVTVVRQTYLPVCSGGNDRAKEHSPPLDKGMVSCYNCANACAERVLAAPR